MWHSGVAYSQHFFLSVPDPGCFLLVVESILSCDTEIIFEYHLQRWKIHLGKDSSCIKSSKSH